MYFPVSSERDHLNVPPVRSFWSVNEMLFLKKFLCQKLKQKNGAMSNCCQLSDPICFLLSLGVDDPG